MYGGYSAVLTLLKENKLKVAGFNGVIQFYHVFFTPSSLISSLPAYNHAFNSPCQVTRGMGWGGGANHGPRQAFSSHLFLPQH
jgi:hypothetical protein